MMGIVCLFMKKNTEKSIKKLRLALSYFKTPIKTHPISLKNTETSYRIPIEQGGIVQLDFIHHFRPSIFSTFFQLNLKTLIIFALKTVNKTLESCASW